MDIFSRHYQYVCPPYAIKIDDHIGKLIKLAEGDRESYLPSCFKIPVLNTDEHFSKVTDQSKIKHKILMQSDNLVLVSVEIFAYDRVSAVDAVFEMLVLLEKSPLPQREEDMSDGNILTFGSDGSSNATARDDNTIFSSSADRSIRIISLMIGDEKRKETIRQE